jgi:tetratricopeptide (TPR) repeat protein
MSSAPQVSRPEAAEGASLFVRPWFMPAVLSCVVCLVYVATLRFQFVYDDAFQVLDNSWLSWRYIPQYFTHQVWAFAGINGSYWRPLFLLWMLAQHALFGTNPAGWHAATVALHAFATVLFYFLALRLSDDRACAAIAALVFALHPALIESVAWVSGSTDPLLAACLLASFIAFLNWRERRSRNWMLTSVGAYALGLMVKEPAVMLLPLLFVFAWLQAADGTLPRRARWAFAAVLPYLPLTLIYAIVHWLITAGRETSGHPATALKMLLTAPSLILFYFRLLVLPWPISPEYPVKLVPHFGIRSVLLPSVAIAAIALAIYLWGRRLVSRAQPDAARLVWFAAWGTVLPLVPVLYLKPLEAHDFAHARYLYLPCIGFALLLAMAIRRLPASSGRLGTIPATQAVAAGVIVLAFAFGNATQQVHWASNLLLFYRGVQVAPENPIALTSLGIEMGKRHEYDKALALLHASMRQDPWDYHTNFSLGYTYLVLGRYEEAAPFLERAAKVRPMDMDPDQFAYLGMAEMKLGNLEKAEWAMRLALKRNPRSRYHYALGLILEQQGRLPEAAQEYQAELKLNPSNADARARLAQAASAAEKQ